MLFLTELIATHSRVEVTLKPPVPTQVRARTERYANVRRRLGFFGWAGDQISSGFTAVQSTVSDAIDAVSDGREAIRTELERKYKPSGHLDPDADTTARLYEFSSLLDAHVAQTDRNCQAGDSFGLGALCESFDDLQDAVETSRDVVLGLCEFASDLDGSYATFEPVQRFCRRSSDGP